MRVATPGCGGGLVATIGTGDEAGKLVGVSGSVPAGCNVSATGASLAFAALLSCCCHGVGRLALCSAFLHPPPHMSQSPAPPSLPPSLQVACST